ncbi:unnamed protein product, partial [marine sediment metagenome]
SREILSRMLRTFMRNCPSLLAEMREALQTGDTEKLRRSAHTLRGSVAMFADGTVVEAVMAVETAARRARLPEAKRAFESMERKMSRFQEQLSAAARENKTCAS